MGKGLTGDVSGKGNHVFKGLGYTEPIFRKLTTQQYACGTEIRRQGLLHTNRLNDMVMSLTLKGLKSI